LSRFNPLAATTGRNYSLDATGIDIEERKQAEERSQKRKKKMWRCEREIDHSSMFEDIVFGSVASVGKVAGASASGADGFTVLIFWVRRGRARSLSLGPFTSNRKFGSSFLFRGMRAIPTALIAPNLLVHEKGRFSRRAAKALEGGLSWPTVEHRPGRDRELPAETQSALLAYSKSGSLKRSGQTTHIFS